MRHSSRLVAAAVCAGVLAGCGSAAGSTPQVSLTVSPEHNACDVAFVEALIPHHRVGIKLAQAAAKRPETQVLAEAIITTQQDEVTRMTGWLTTWGVTAAPASASAAPKGDPVKALAAHQEDAVTLAQKEQAQGSNPTALAFAKQVIESRTAEASQLRAAVS